MDGHKILYDTGASSDMVLNNAKALHIDLSAVEDVVLSHNHWEHVGGLMTLRRELAKTNPRALIRVRVGARIFEPRLTDGGDDHNGLRLIKAEYLATGGVFIVHDKPHRTLSWSLVDWTGAPAEHGKELVARTIACDRAGARGR